MPAEDRLLFRNTSTLCSVLVLVYTMMLTPPEGLHRRYKDRFTAFVATFRILFARGGGKGGSAN